MRNSEQKKPRLAYVGHIFHTKTKSTEFLKSSLREAFAVTEYAIDPWKGAKVIPVETLNQYEYVLFFQRISPIADVRKLTANVIYVEMYDSANRDYFYWKNLSFLKMKILAFSEKTAAQCRKFGIDCLQVKYFLNPEDYILPIPQSGRHLFFWNRGSIPWEVIKRVIDPNQIDSLLYLSTPDPGYGRETIEPEDVRKYKMEIVTREFTGSSHSDYIKLLSRANVFIAPRRKEGIGMSFLEAVAAGQCVIANNESTMNEYFADGKTGYLFDADNPKPLNISNSKVVAENSRRMGQNGFHAWLKDSEKIIPFLKSEFSSAQRGLLKREVFAALYDAKLILHRYKQK